jgi:heme/copper-type cytochrome/quinol oxidase subunit 4
MEKIRTVVNEKALKELFHNARVLALVALIFSIVLGSLYVATAATDGDWYEAIKVFIVVLACILMFLSVFLFINCKKAITKNNAFIREVEYDFQEDGLAFEVFRNGEKIESGKLPYEDLVDYRETKSYVSVRLGNNSCFIIDKVAGLIEFLESKNIKKIGSRNPKKK